MLPSSEVTIRGYSRPSLIIIDEASRVLDEVYWATRPMRAVFPGDLLLLSTPNGQRGFFYEAWVGERQWKRVQIKAENCPRISEEFLAQERLELRGDIYRQEYECEFLAMAGGLFTVEQIASMFVTRPEDQAIADDMLKADMLAAQIEDAAAWHTSPIGQQLDRLDIFRDPEAEEESNKVLGFPGP